MLLSMLLAGCWGSREIEHMIYANTIGIDYVKDQVVVYIQMVNFSGVAKKESGTSQPQKTFLGKAQGESFDSALFNMYASSPQRIVWSNVKTIVFSERALKQGLVREVLDVWDRYYEFRYTVWAMATKEPMDKALNTQAIADLSVIYSQLNNPTKTYEQSSVIAPMYLYKFIWKWKEKGETVLLPYLEIKHGWTENKKPNPNLGVSGVCLLENQKFQGCLTVKDILGLRWLEKDTKRTPLELKEGKTIKAMMVMNKVKSSIHPKLRRGKPAFDIKVSMQATLPQLNTSLHKRKFELQAAKEIKDQIMGTYMKGLDKDIDLYGLSAIFRRSMPDAWSKLSTKGKIPLDSSSIEHIDIKVNLISGGISKMR
jgi:Ger(x)C family germination protein